MSYEKEYKVIDEILEGTSRKTSPFTAKDGAKMLDGLFERAVHIPVWVLSLGNAVVSVEDLEAKMAKHGRKTKAIALKYQHLPAVATDEKKRENREFIVVGVDDACLQRYVLLRGDRAEVVPDAVVEQDTGAPGPQRPASRSLPGDPGEQGKADFAQEGFSLLGAQPITVGHGGVDRPHAVLLERPLDGDGEVRLGGHDASASLGTGSHVKESHE